VTEKAMFGGLAFLLRSRDDEPESSYCFRVIAHGSPPRGSQCVRIAPEARGAREALRVAHMKGADSRNAGSLPTNVRCQRKSIPPAWKPIRRQPRPRRRRH
jgi:hypothetical protein